MRRQLRLITGLTILAGFALAGTARADYVLLKTGQVIEGKIVDLGTKVSITVNGRKALLPKSFVAKIVKGDPPAGSRKIDLASQLFGKHRPVAKARPKKVPARMTAAERSAAVKVRLAARQRARELISTFAAKDVDKSEAALNEMVMLEPFPTLTIAGALGDSRPKVRRMVVRALGQSGENGAAAPLVRSALHDKDEAVRTTASKLIGKQGNPKALNLLIQEARKARDKYAIERAGDAIRNVGNKSTVTAMIAYARLDIRVAQTSSPTMTTIPMQTIQTIDTAGGGVVVPVSMPIELPEMDIKKVNTSVCVPILEVLGRATGMNHGGNVDAWADWWQGARNNFEFKN